MIQFLDKPNFMIFSKDQIAYRVKLTTTTETHCTVEVRWKKDAVTNVLIASAEKGVPDPATGEVGFAVNSTIDAFLEQTIETAFSSGSALKNWTTDLLERSVDGMKVVANFGKGIFFEEFKVVLKSYRADGTIVDTQEKELQAFLGSSGNQASSFFSAPLTLLSNQPQSKQIIPAQNELLYMHCAIDAVLELDINIALSDGNTLDWQFFGVDTNGENKVVALGIGYADLVRMAEKMGADELAKIDAPEKVVSYSVGWKTGSLKARKQSYILQQATRHERQFLFWESGGSWATFSATGQLKSKLKTGQETGTRHEFLRGRGHSKTLTWNKAVARLEHKLQTGFFSREMRGWLQAFAESHSRYEVAQESGLYPVVVTSKTYNLYPDEFKPKSVEFSYRRATSEPLYRKILPTLLATQPSIKLSGFAQNTGNVDLLWASSGFVNVSMKNFEVWRGTSPTVLQKIAEGVGLGAHTDNATNPETTYYYQIKATEAGDEVLSNFSVLTTPEQQGIGLNNVIITEADVVWEPGNLGTQGKPRIASISWDSSIIGEKDEENNEVRIEWVYGDTKTFVGLRGTTNGTLSPVTYTYNGPFGTTTGWITGDPGIQITIEYFVLKRDFIFGDEYTTKTSLTLTIPNI